ncbi:MAG: protein kinase [Verrucomicrobia bacterium]|nr:protein kinase [Verrucomicrobiota bacterium]
MDLSSSDADPTLRGESAGARVFGRYTLIEILGRGGMGVVWRARDETLGEEVALKFLPDAVRWDPGAFDDLKEETRRARQLTHPNIVRIHDFVEDAAGAAISMELVEGQTLTALRLQRPAKILEPADILPWLPQLCAALDFAHQEARVVHRDLKPSNLMLTTDGRLKVTDFGVARSMADSISRVSMMSAGTLVYMSPQQAMGEEPSPADDIYAVGATLYELLTGKPPFHTGDVRVQLFQRRPDSIATRRRVLGHAAGSVSREWEATVAACLAKEAEARPSSAGEVIRRLQRAAPSARRWWRLPTRREATLAGVAAAVAGGVFWWHGHAVAGAAVASPVEFPSDAGRALAAWNFDGDARDGSGRGLHGEVASAVPTTDRFGRIDRALKFNGQAWVTVPDSPRFRWDGKSPFTVALWVRNDESPTLSGYVCGTESTTVGGLEWMLGFQRGRPAGCVRRVQSVADHCLVEADTALPVGKWHHLALVSDGTRLLLHVDGRLVAAKPLGALRTAAASESVQLTFGRPSISTPWAFDGALDDARIWSRDLAAGELAVLAGREASPRIVLTRGRYSNTENLAAAVRDEFGPDAGLLDWKELVRWHADDAWGLAEELGFAPSHEIAWVQRDRQRLFDDKRHYFLGRFDGRKPDYFKVHEEVGGLTLALGSWYGMRIPAFALLPPARLHHESLERANGAPEIRRAGRIDRAVRALQLSWRVRLSPTTGALVAARL